jgi:hypothetical protein
MSFRYRLLAVVALLAAGGASAAEAQRGTFRAKRPPYAYFKYRIPRVSEFRAPRIHLRDDIRLRALERMDQVRERQFDLQNRLRERQFSLQDRTRERRFELQDRAWRRQLEGRERALSRMHERMDRVPKLRPFVFRWRSRTI